MKKMRGMKRVGRMMRRMTSLVSEMRRGAFQTEAARTGVLVTLALGVPALKEERLQEQDPEPGEPEQGSEGGPQNRNRTSDRCRRQTAGQSVTGEAGFRIQSFFLFELNISTIKPFFSMHSVTLDTASGLNSHNSSFLFFSEVSSEVCSSC